MKFQTAHQSAHRLRIRIAEKELTDSAQEVLEYALTSIPGVRKVSFYPATGGIGICFDCAPEEITRRLERLRFDNVEMMAREMDARQSIGVEELRERKLSPKLKRKLRRRIALESAADLLMPAPVQLGYHLYQLITLREF